MPTIRNVPAFSRQIQTEVLIERILIGLEEPFDERLVDDRDRRGGFVVGLAEHAPAQKGDAKVLEIVGAHPVP